MTGLHVTDDLEEFAAATLVNLRFEPPPAGSGSGR
jgi:hypothetical protein